MIILKLKDSFNTFFKKNLSINSAVIIGSFGRGDSGANSDIDYQILVDDSFDNDTFLCALKKEFSEDLQYFLFLQEKRKYCFYFTSDYLKIEVFVCKKLTDLNKYFLGSEIKDISKSIIFDRTKNLCSYLENITNDKCLNFDKNIHDTIVRLISEFQCRFEQCSESHFRSDAYKFSVLLSHALNAVVRLIYLTDSNKKYNYFPPNFLTDYAYKLNLGVENIGTMDLPQANVHKRRLLDLFESYLPKIIKKFDLSISERNIIDFLENIYMRDYFWNFRDISKYNKKLQSGFVYRSSALCLCQDLDKLNELLDRCKISTIIDLRAEREVEAIDYSSDFKKNINIVNAHFDPWNQSEEFKSLHNIGSNEEIAYSFFSFECKDSIKQVLLSILNSKCAVNIHCHAGKDRTGIIISLLHLLSGVTMDIVFLDYLASEMDTKKEYINILLNEIERVGGIKKYLISCKLTVDDILKLKKKICV